MKPLTKPQQTINIDDLNAKDFNYVKKSVELDQLKKQYAIKLKQENFDSETLIDNWLAQYRSAASKETYGIGLKVFLEWLDTAQKNLFALTSFDADEYLLHVKDLYIEDNTQRIRLAAVVSFCKYLVRHAILEQNVFYGIKWPKRLYETKDADEIPLEEDLLIIEEQLREELHATGTGSQAKQRQAARMLVVFTIIKYQGVRVGALPFFKIDRSMQYKAKSKGSIIAGTLHPEVTALLKEMHIDRETFFQGLNTKTLQKSFERICKRLVSLGLLHTVFSLHDIRHYAAVKHYTTNKDLIATQRFLGHANVSITQTYLASLRCDC